MRSQLPEFRDQYIICELCLIGLVMEAFRLLPNSSLSRMESSVGSSPVVSVLPVSPSIAYSLHHVEAASVLLVC